MAIIVDLHQISLASMFVSLGSHTNAPIDEGMIRHLILNSLRGINVKFKATHGELVIATDSSSWRREYFPYYKAGRRKEQSESDLDWKTVYSALNHIKDELQEFFPYRVIRVDGAEADDIIAALTIRLAGESEILAMGEKVMIVSGDKDFGQLQRYAGVDQYDPVKKKMIKVRDPEMFLREHIIRGDKGDGIPNILSPDNCLVIGEKQKSIMSKKLEQWIKFDDPKDFCDERMLRNYHRNKTLIDLRCAPDDLHRKINESYDAEAGKGRSKLLNYFIANKLRILAEKAQEF